MWPVAITYVALGGLALVGLWIVVQLVTWNHSRKILTRRHKRIRLATSIVLILLLGVVLLGSSGDFSYNLAALVFIWGACTVLLMALVVLALYDLRETMVSYAQNYMELSHKLVEEEKRNHET